MDVFKSSVADMKINMRMFREVDTLDLSSTHITDKGLSPVRKAVNLSSLSLRNTSVSDEAVAHLAPLANLREVDLSNTRIGNGSRKRPVSHFQTVDHSYSFGPKGRRIAAGSVDKTLKVWDASRSQPRK